ncbi:MAG: DUF5053 domain-containing protein [Bacteroidaceae bacterium]|nr:DUF5053 domain-containing protein [Bacteroidaceae bacterium]
MREQLRDIALHISWRHIAQDYFPKSVPWFYQRMNGVDGRGNHCEFTTEEKAQLRGALCDFADRVRRASENII